MRAKEFLRYVRAADSIEEKSDRLGTLNDMLLEHIAKAAEKREPSSLGEFVSILKEANEIKSAVYNGLGLESPSNFALEYIEALSHSGRFQASDILKLQSYFKEKD